MNQGRIIQRVAKLEETWANTLLVGCPSCGPTVMDCDHIEGYHHALSDLRDALYSKSLLCKLGFHDWTLCRRPTFTIRCLRCAASKTHRYYHGGAA